jgi:hypothetical protein
MALAAYRGRAAAAVPFHGNPADPLGAGDASATPAPRPPSVVTTSWVPSVVGRRRRQPARTHLGEDLSAPAPDRASNRPAPWRWTSPLVAKRRAWAPAAGAHPKRGQVSAVDPHASHARPSPLRQGRLGQTTKPLADPPRHVEPGAPPTGGFPTLLTHSRTHRSADSADAETVDTGHASAGRPDRTGRVDSGRPDGHPISGQTPAQRTQDADRAMDSPAGVRTSPTATVRWGYQPVLGYSICGLGNP